MRLVNTVLGILLAASSLIASSAQAGPSAGQLKGGMTSSGGDWKEMSWESAWFLGAAPISYCIEIAPTETLSVEQAKSDFESVVKIWRAYVNQRLRYSGVGHELNFNYSMEPCQANTRLKLYIGSSNASIEKGKQAFQNPYAFAQRENFDPKSGMGQGFIWFAPSKSIAPLANFPNWSGAYTFHAMLLHELGHVLGNGHIDDTIMEADLVSTLQMADSTNARDAAVGKMYATNIDHHKFLKLAADSNLNMKGIINLEQSGTESARIFELLAGRKSNGGIEASVQKVGYTAVLAYKDDTGLVAFRMDLSDSGRSDFNLGGQTFHTVRNIGYGDQGEFSTPAGYSFATKLISKSGVDYFAIVNINGENIGRPVDVRILEGSKFTKVFQADLLLTHGIK